MALKRRNTLPIVVIAAVLVVVAVVLNFSNRGMIPEASFQRPSASMNYDMLPTQGLAGDFEAYGGEPGAPMEAADGTLQTEMNAQERVILKTASLRIVVDAADSAMTQITNMAEAMGGWVVSSSTSMVRTADGQDVAQGSITIRVPAEKLNEALSQIKSGAGEIEYESVSGQDVTQQYVDLNSRLTNLEAAETQLRQIMEEARRTEDVLNVYNQLVSTRGEIERIRGQLQYFQEAAAYSSISIDVIPKAIEAPIQIAGWSPGRTVESALAALLNVLRFGADVLITVVVLGIPLVVIISLPLWLVRRAWRRRGAQAAA
jgi:hypothetical protein